MSAEESSPSGYPQTDQERLKLITQTISQHMEGRWDEIDELWVRQVKPLLRLEIEDEEFIKRLAAPISLRIMSIGIQAGLEGLLRASKVFDGPFRIHVAPSGTVSIKLD
jgi:hypothetical protein